MASASMNVSIAALILALIAVIIVIRGAIIQSSQRQISLRELGTGGGGGEKRLLPSSTAGRGSYSAVNERWTGLHAHWSFRNRIEETRKKEENGKEWKKES